MSQAQHDLPQDIQAYRHRFSHRRVDDDPGVKAWIAAKHVIWATLLAGSFLIYYFASAMVEAISLPRLVVSAPAKVVAPLRSPGSF